MVYQEHFEITACANANGIMPSSTVKYVNIVRKKFNTKRLLDQFNKVSDLEPEGIFNYCVDFNSHVIVVVVVDHFIESNWAGKNASRGGK